MMKKRMVLLATVLFIVGAMTPICFAPPSGDIEWDFMDSFDSPIGGDAPMWIDPDGDGAIDPFQIVGPASSFNPGAYAFTNPDGLGHLAYTTNMPLSGGGWTLVGKAYGEPSFGVEVMCDMTISGGGWTLCGVASLVDDATGSFYFAGVEDTGSGSFLSIKQYDGMGGWMPLSMGSVSIPTNTTWNWVIEIEGLTSGNVEETISLYNGDPSAGGMLIDQVTATEMPWLTAPGQGYMGLYVQPGAGATGGPVFDKYYQYKTFNDQIKVMCGETIEPTGGWRYDYHVQLDGYLDTLGIGSGVSDLMHYRSIWGPTHRYGITYNNDPGDWVCYGPSSSGHGVVSPPPNGFCEYPFWWWNIDHHSSYDFGFVAPSGPHNVTWKASGTSYDGGSAITDESDWAEPVGLGDGPVHGPTDDYDPDNLPYGFVQAIPISLSEIWWFDFTGIPVRPIFDPIWRLYGDDVINSDLYFSDPTEVEPVFYANMLTPGKEYLLGVSYTNTGGSTPFDEVIYAPVRLDCPEADLSGDCFVNLVDFAMLAEQWLTGDGMGGPM